MASSVYFMVGIIFLAATLAQGQSISSCPLDSCRLTDQVYLCQTGNVSGSCPISCNTALRGSDGTNSLDQCCNNIVEMIQSTPRTVENERSCTTTDTPAGEDIDRVNGNQESVAGGDIFAGIYIANQARFKFSCSGCIRSIQLAVTTSSQLKDNEGNETIHFHLFTSKTDDNLIVQREKTFTWVSSVLMNGSDRLLVEYRSLSGSEVCFTQEDKFGFTIDAGLEVALKSRLTSSTDDLVLNVSSQLPTSGCPKLNESGLYQFDTSTNSLLSPLVHIKIGPPSAEVVTTEPPAQADTTSPSIVTDRTSSTPLTPTTAGLSLSSPALPGYVIYAAGGFAGIICILLLLVIVVVSICIIQRRKHKTYQYGGKINLSSESPFNRGFNEKNGDIAMTKFSPRMSHLVESDGSRKNVITLENPMADPADFTSHHYDLPTELIHDHRSANRMNFVTNMSRESFTTMNTVTSSMSDSVSQMSKTYDSAPELGTTPLLRRHGGTVKNPLYQATGPQEPTYDNPAELIVHEKKKISTLGTSFEGDGIYTETGMVGTPAVEIPSISLSIDGESHYTPPPDELENNTTAFNPYHELLPGEVDNETGHHYFFLERERKNTAQAGSLGRHRVYEPGLYVPDAEERKQMTMRKGENPGSIYEIFEEKHRKNSGKKKKFFKEEDQFWKPDEDEYKIYNQLSEKQYREILRGQIAFEDHLGVGQFGSVSRATWSNEEGAKKVAVKTLKPTMLIQKKVKFLQEAAIMGQFFHSNVIRLFGVVTVGEPVMIVMELMALGDLSKYLWENYRLHKMAPPQPITLLSFCRQVACGMKYLAKKKYVHRDLAARNVFISETLVCKVGDFGMSRHLEENYYLSTGGTVPIKWTAPEGLNYKKFSTASDVYSYGMLLYEIWSLGEKPLANIKIADVANLVTQGYCQPPPPGCPRKIYETMVKCWDPKYNERPSFDELFELLNRTDSDVLSWSAADKDQCTHLATQIGAPLSEGASLFMDLQKTYQVTLV